MRIAIGISYDGAPFEGWQSQSTGNGVQDHLERALSAIADSPIRLAAAGRTDAGVHACAQVAHFDTAAVRPINAWVRGVNASLPQEIAVQWAQPVHGEYHARFSAQARSYRYVLYCDPVRPSLLAGKVGWTHTTLDIDAMRAATAALLGEHDFSAFRSSECQAKSPVRTMLRAEIEMRGSYVMFDFTANAFLHHMVRNIVGCLVYIGSGRQPTAWMDEVIAARDRRIAAPTFSAAGLYLTAVRYAATWNLPEFRDMLPFGNGETVA